MAYKYTRISLADDLTQEVDVRRSQGGRQAGVAGEVRQYASGRLRAVVRSAQPATLSLTFRTKDRSVIDTLQQWCGRTVLVRDPRGRAEWCVFFTVDETDTAPDWTDVSLPLVRVTTGLAIPPEGAYGGYLVGY